MTNLAIGTKVNYLHTSIIDNHTTWKVSEVVGHEFDGRFNYVVLENGDKMFSQALSVHKTFESENEYATQDNFGDWTLNK